MAKLVKESSGYWTAPDGSRAVSMMRSLPVSFDGFKRFQFRNTPLQPVITIEWPEAIGPNATPNDIALLPAAVAASAIQHGYARQPKDEHIAAWNAAWDAPPVKTAPPASTVNTAPVNVAVTNVAPVNTAQTAPDAELVTATAAAAAAASAMAAQAPNSAQDGQNPAGGGEGSQNAPTPPGDAPKGPGASSTPKPQASKGGKSSGKK